MPLDRTDALLVELEAATVSPAVANFLAQYASVVLYSEMEELIASLVKTRLSAYTHEAIANFITASLEDLIKRTPKSDIAKFCDRFGSNFKDAFNGRVNDRQITSYSNVIQARHDVGHRRGSNVTLTEVRTGWTAANRIYEALSLAFDEICGPLTAPDGHEGEEAAQN